MGFPITNSFKKKKSLRASHKHLSYQKCSCKLQMLESNSHLPVLNVSFHELNCHGDNTVIHIIFTACMASYVSYLSSLNPPPGARPHILQLVAHKGTCGTPGPPYCAPQLRLQQGHHNNHYVCESGPYHTETQRHAIYQDMFPNFPDKLLKVHVLQKNTQAANVISQGRSGIAGAERFSG